MTTIPTNGMKRIYGDPLSFSGRGSLADPIKLLDSGADAISVRAFGAVGDGVADDATAVASAVAAALSGGKRLHFPRGTYKLNSAITISAPNGIHISGRDSTISFASTARNAFNVSTSSSRIVFDGITFQAEINDDKNTNTGCAISVTSPVTDVDISNCVFNYGRPVVVSSDGSTIGRFSFCSNRVLNATNPVSTPQYSIISNNWFICSSVVSTRAQAIYLFGPMEGCSITGNVFRNIAEEDIQIRAAAARFDQKFGFIIADNYFENSNQYSIWVGSDTTLKAGAYSITGNVFKNCNSPILAQGLSDSVIANNVCEWDWEYPGSRSGSRSAISVTNGGTFAQHYGTSKGVIVANNVATHRNPFFGIVTMNALPTAGQTITVGSVTYTWRATAAVAGEITIVAGDIPDTLGNLQNALLGRDGINTSMNTVLRGAEDVIYNAFPGLDSAGVTNKLVVISNAAFSISTTATNTAITAVIDNRDAQPIGIAASMSMAPLIADNTLTDFNTSMTLNSCFKPIVSGNVMNGGSGIVAIGSVFSIYRDNCWPDNTPGHMCFRQLLMQDGFPLIYDNGLISEQEYMTPELTGLHGKVSAGDGKARTFLYYGIDNYGDGDANTLPFSWRDGDLIQLRATGKASLDFTFKRTAPGANQFNTATGLIALINASSDWTASFAQFTNMGGTPDPQCMIQIKLAAAGAAPDARLYCTTRAKTCGVMLRDYDYDGEVYARLLGGSAARDKTAIFSPRANKELTPMVAGVDATSHALDPVVYQADVVPGVGAVITHDVATGTEAFVFNFRGQ